MVDPTLPLSIQTAYPRWPYTACYFDVSLSMVIFSRLMAGPVLCCSDSQWLQTPVIIFPVPRLGFVKLPHRPMPTNGGLFLLLPPFNLESSHIQPIPGIQPVYIVLINSPTGVTSLSVLEILYLVTHYRWLHLAQLTPRVTVVGNQPTPLLTCFSTNVSEWCPVSVLVVQLPPPLSNCAFYSGWIQVEIVCPTCVLDLILGIADGRSNLSREAWLDLSNAQLNRIFCFWHC